MFGVKTWNEKLKIDRLVKQIHFGSDVLWLQSSQCSVLRLLPTMLTLPHSPEVLGTLSSHRWAKMAKKIWANDWPPETSFFKVMLHCWNSVQDLLRWILCTWSKWNLTQEAIASDEPAEAQIGSVQRPSDCITHFWVPAIRETDRKQEKSWTNPRISKFESLRYDQPGLWSKVFVNFSHQLSGQLSGGLECNGFCFGKP